MFDNKPFVATISGVLTAGVLGVASLVGGWVDFGNKISVNSGGGDVIIVAPSPNELACPRSFVEVQRGVAHVDVSPGVGYVACDRTGEYSLTRTLSNDVLRDWLGNEVTDPDRIRAVLGE